MVLLVGESFMNTRKPVTSTEDLFQKFKRAAPVVIPGWTATELAVETAVGNFRQLDWKGKVQRTGGASLNAMGGMLLACGALSLFQKVVSMGVDTSKVSSLSPVNKR
jgi:hypothetical protein